MVLLGVLSEFYNSTRMNALPFDFEASPSIEASLSILPDFFISSIVGLVN